MSRSYTYSPPQAPPRRVAGLLYLLPPSDVYEMLVKSMGWDCFTQLRPLTGVLLTPRWYMDVEWHGQYYWQGKTKELGKTPPECQFAYHKPIKTYKDSNAGILSDRLWHGLCNSIGLHDVSGPHSTPVFWWLVTVLKQFYCFLLSFLSTCHRTSLLLKGPWVRSHYYNYLTNDSKK
jgi:hypothetical protein